MEVYLDLVVILNFLVDFLLLLGTNRLSGFPLAAKRCAVAALLGGIYSGCCILPGFRFLGNILWRTVSLVLMAGIAFGWGKGTLKRCGVFLLLSMALGGMALRFGRGDFAALLLCVGLIYLLSRLSFGEGVGSREYIPVQITCGDRSVSMLALLDTGNTLRDPVTGEQVLVISGEVAQRLTGLTKEQLKCPLETLAKQPISGLRLIPYQAVGQGGSMLLAMRFDQVKVGSREGSAVVAFAPEGLGEGQVFQALTGGVL